MKPRIVVTAMIGVLVAGLLLSACGGSGESSQRTKAPSGAKAGSATPESEGQGGEEGAVQSAEAPSEAESAATGDIPDNQTFLVFKDPSAGYTIRYPEGWARKGQGNDVTFKEKANLIHIAVKSGSAKNKPGEKRTVTRQSAPDPVTGKRLPLTVDVYEFEQGGKVAVLELSTPEGVDNVDAYRLISESFAWR
ncbi:MAG TPA: PsbP-related protein [Solirubrobacterales bacterium]|nr:PsbP-related protein [Solirubrobacterales bacterium]